MNPVAPHMKQKSSSYLKLIFSYCCCLTFAWLFQISVFVIQAGPGSFSAALQDDPRTDLNEVKGHLEIALLEKHFLREYTELNCTLCEVLHVRSLLPCPSIFPLTDHTNMFNGDNSSLITGQTVGLRLLIKSRLYESGKVTLLQRD